MENKKSSLMFLGSIGVLFIGLYLFNDLTKLEDTNVYIDDLVYEEKDIEHNVELSDDNVVAYSSEINITKSGIYIFEGDYNNTTISVDVDKTIDEDVVYIVLNNANITGYKESVIDIIEAKDVVITVEENTSNYISQTYSTNDVEYSGAVIYSKADLIINGEGYLYIDTNYNDGINSRDDLTIENTNIVIDAAADGVVGKDLVVLINNNMSITSLKDGIKATNDLDVDKGSVLIESGIYNIDSTQDAISAAETIQIDDGEFNITTSGGFSFVIKDITVGEGSNGYVQPTYIDYSAKALKALNIKIYDGIFNISSFEDAIHSDYDLYIANGVFVIECGDDGIHANNNLIIDGGNITITDGYEGIEGANITINDGNIDVAVLDDAINCSSGMLTINNGVIKIYSKGDGIDSNGDLTINDGTIIIESDAIYTMGDSSIDVSGSIVVTGGTIVDEKGNEIDYNQVMSSQSNHMTTPGRR